jgi:Ser/Thr protein kinase RdoA (MazF antagonist)
LVALESIPQPRQLELLRQVAYEALPHFSFRARRLRVLRFVRNAVFRVELTGGHWLVLRVYRAEHQDPLRAHLEAAFLQQLAEHSPIHAPQPVPTRRGLFLLEFESRVLGGRVFVVALRPVLGRRPPITCPSARTVELAGAALAEMHIQGREMHLRQSLRLPHADWGPFVLRGLSLPATAKSHLGAPTSKRLRRNIGRARHFLAEVEDRRAGVLHGDFHQGNYLLSRGAVCPIDFADCAVGPFACDVATAITALTARPGYAVKRAAFLRGYRSRMEFFGSEEKALDALVAVRVGISLAHVFGRPDHPYLEPKALRRYVALTRGRLREVGVAV